MWVTTVVFLLLVGLGGTVHVASQGDTRETLSGSLDRGIFLLEKKDYVSYLKELLPPEDLKRLTVKMSVERVAAQQAERGDFGKILMWLKAARTLKPQIVRDGTLAIFRFTAPIEGRETLALTKIGSYWYIF